MREDETFMQWFKRNRLHIIRFAIVSQAIIIFLSGIVHGILGNSDKWFSRLALGLILFGMYGIMKHLEANKK